MRGARAGTPRPAGASDRPRVSLGQHRNHPALPRKTSEKGSGAEVTRTAEAPGRSEGWGGP